MAIAHVARRGTGVAIAAGSTVAIATATAAVPVGRQLLVSFFSDNIATADGNSNTHQSVSDGLGNTYTKIYEQTNTVGGAALDGTTVSLWLCDVTVQIPIGTNITLTLSATTAVDKGGYANEFSVAAGMKLGLVTGTGSPAGLNTDASAGFGSMSISGLASAARLYFRIGSKEANTTTAITVSTGFTTTGATLRTRNNTVAQSAIGEFRINTSTGETSNPTLAVTGDTASIFAAFAEVTNAVDATATPSGVGASTATGTPTIRVDAIVQTVGAAVTALGSAIATGTANVAPAGAAATSAIGTSTGKGDGTASPAGGASGPGWQSVSGATVAGNGTITNTGSEARLVSDALASDWSIDFTITSVVDSISGVHSAAAFPTPYYAIDYAWMITVTPIGANYYADVRLAGGYAAEVYYAIGDVLRIAKSGTTVSWYHNGALIHSATVPAVTYYALVQIGTASGTLQTPIGVSAGGGAVATMAIGASVGSGGATAVPSGSVPTVAKAIRTAPAVDGTGFMRDSGTFPSYDAITIAGWFRHHDSGGGFNGYETPFFYGNDDSTNYVMFYTDGSSIAPQMRVQIKTSADGYHEADVRAVSEDGWYYIALTFDASAGNKLTGYVMAAGESAVTKASVTGWAPPASAASYFMVGQNTYRQEWAGDYCFVRLWSAVLTDAEILAEMNAAAPVRSANLVERHDFQSLAGVMADDSGNGNVFTGADGTQSLVTSGPTVNVGGGGALATMTLGTVTATGSSDPNATATPAGVGATATAGGSASGAANIATSGRSVTAALGTATGRGSGSAIPAGAGTTTGFGAATGRGDGSGSPAGRSATISAGSATVTGGTGATTTPAGSSVSATVGSLTVTGTGNVTPTGRQASIAIGNWQASAGTPATALPAGVALTSAVGSPSTTGTADVALGGVQSDAFVGAPSIGAGATVTASGVQSVTAPGQFIVSADSAVDVVGVLLTTAIGTAIAVGTTGAPGITDVVRATIAFTRNIWTATEYRGSVLTSTAIARKARATAGYRHALQLTGPIRRSVHTTVER